MLTNLLWYTSNVQEALGDLLEKTEKYCPVDNTKDIYTDLISEEYKEFLAEKDGTPEQYKELCDLIWVCIQKANKQGYDLGLGLNALWEEYNSKFYTADGEFNPIYREDGKLLKNTGFKKANFKELMD